MANRNRRREDEYRREPIAGAQRPSGSYSTGTREIGGNTPKPLPTGGSLSGPGTSVTGANTRQHGIAKTNPTITSIPGRKTGGFDASKLQIGGNTPNPFTNGYLQQQDPIPGVPNPFTVDMTKPQIGGNTPNPFGGGAYQQTEPIPGVPNPLGGEYLQQDIGGNMPNPFTGQYGTGIPQPIGGVANPGAFQQADPISGVPNPFADVYQEREAIPGVPNPLTGGGTFSSGDIRDQLNSDRLDSLEGAVPNLGGGSLNNFDRAAALNYGGSWDGYDDWRQSVADEGLFFSDDDMQRAMTDQAFANALTQAKRNYARAEAAGDQAGMQAAHAAAERARAQYKYSGGGFGDEYLPWEDPEPTQPNRPTYDPTDISDMPAYDTRDAGTRPTWDPSSGGERPEWTGSGYDAEIDRLLKEALDYPPYSSEYKERIDAALRRIEEYGPYQSEYKDRMEQQLQALLDRDPFSYDLDSDPAWQAYKKQYTREGQRASADAMAQAALMTGGVPSSYASTAAQQAGNYYNAQMTDKIPELYRLAYEMYLNDGDRMASNLSLMRGLDNDAYGRYADTYSRMLSGLDALQGQDATEYGRYADAYNRLLSGLDVTRTLRNDEYGRFRDTVGDWQNDRNFNYDLWRQQVGDWENDRDFGYGAYRDSVSDWRNNRDFDYDRYRDEMDDWRYDRSYDDSRADTEYERRLNEALAAAEYGDYSKLQAMGINPDNDALLRYTLARNGRTTPVGSGGGGGGGSGAGTPKATTGGIDHLSDRGKAILSAAKGNPDLARQYIDNNWDEMDYIMRLSLLEELGYSAQEAMAYASVDTDVGYGGGMTGEDIQAFLGSGDGAQGDIYDQMFAAGITTEDEAKRWLQQHGYKYTEANDAAKTFAGLYDSGTFGGAAPDTTARDIAANINSEKDAIAYLEDHGVTAKPLSREQWAISSSKSQFATYNDYLRAFVYEYMNGG